MTVVSQNKRTMIRDEIDEVYRAFKGGHPKCNDTSREGDEVSIHPINQTNLHVSQHLEPTDNSMSILSGRLIAVPGSPSLPAQVQHMGFSWGFIFD